MFCGIGKPLPACAPLNEKGLRRCRSPLLEGLSLICADPVCLVRVAGPPKLSAKFSAPVTKSSRAKTAGARKCSYFSRRGSRFAKAFLRAPARHCFFFPQFRVVQERISRRPIVSADGVGAVHALPGTRRDPIRPAGPAASWSSRFGAGPQVRGRQLIPISTAILIRSEWFLAPSFCLSRDVVLATVL